MLAGDRVVAAGVKWMTAHDPAEGQPPSAQYTMTAYGLVSIHRAGRGEATGRGNERGDDDLIPPNAAQDEPPKQPYNGIRRLEGIVEVSSANYSGCIWLRRLLLCLVPPALPCRC